MVTGHMLSEQFFYSHQATIETFVQLFMCNSVFMNVSLGVGAGLGVTLTPRMN